jgi:hypothetical protein
MKVLCAWLGLSLQGANLAWDAQSVIALRLMRLGMGGAKAQAEARRMLSEKFAAAAEVQVGATAAAMLGQNSHRVAKKAFSAYRKRVRRNRRRLAR